MNIAIDIGNTRTKLGVFSGHDLVLNRAFDGSGHQALIEILEEYTPEALILSSTFDIPAPVTEQIAKVSKYIILDQHTPLPFINCYHTQDTLGKDRIALVAAAMAHYPKQDNLVIGCGTCITFNFINAQHEFIGGSIHPGLRMRLKAMHHFTGKLPELDLSGNVELIGTDTRSNMMTGTVFAAAREIDGMIDEYLVKFPQMNIIITGGDADMLVSRLKNEIFALPDCTLIGLNHILQHNA
jgi:type III pantothenate kinase